MDDAPPQTTDRTKRAPKLRPEPLPRTNTKAQRALERHFAASAAFDVAGGGFSPLPWILRRLLWKIPPRAWMIYTYLLLRAGREAVVWVTDREIGFDVGLHFKKVASYLRELEVLSLVEIQQHAGERFIFLPDPRALALRLAQDVALDDERRAAIEDELNLVPSKMGANTPEKAENPYETRDPNENG